MARRSAKRILLDEITILWKAREKAMDKWKSAVDSVESTMEEITACKETYLKLNAKLEEAEICAKLIGADTSEVLRAERDAEIIYWAKIE